MPTLKLYHLRRLSPSLKLQLVNFRRVDPLIRNQNEAILLIRNQNEAILQSVDRTSYELIL